VLTYPTEFVKTHLQLQSKLKPEYSGIWNCITKTVARDGFTGLYRGLTPLVVGSIPKQCVRWFAYDLISGKLKGTGELDAGKRALAGFCAGGAEALFAVIPMETVKTKIIDDKRSANPQYKGAMDGVVKIIRAEGFGGIYRGIAATTVKQGLNQATRFPFQNFFVQIMAGDNKAKQRDPIINGIAGMGAGGVSVLVTQPADVIKTRMQGHGHGHGHGTPSAAEVKAAPPAAKGNFISVGLDLLRKEGPMFFYAGTAPRMLRVCFDAGATFAVFPLIQQAMDKYVWGVGEPKAHVPKPIEAAAAAVAKAPVAAAAAAPPAAKKE